MAADVLTEIFRLPAEQRAKLALELIRSLDGKHDADAWVLPLGDDLRRRRHSRLPG